jgi:hypothetical protein
MDKLQVKYINPKELKPWAKNPRINDKAAEKLSKLIERFGFVNPIICDKDGTVRAGHTRLKAALKLGLEQVPVIYKDFSNDSEAMAFALADNKSNEWAEWDFPKLDTVLDDLKIEDFDLSIIGMNIGQPDNPNDEWEGMPEFENHPKAARTIHVHFENLEDANSFARIIGQKISEKTSSIWYPEKQRRDMSGVYFENES